MTQKAQSHISIQIVPTGHGTVGTIGHNINKWFMYMLISCTIFKQLYIQMAACIYPFGHINVKLQICLHYSISYMYIAIHCIFTFLK